ncbi:kelch domain-containing protein 9 isoform X2 [Dendrobates tinctorius]|uniref:kelch domain-containing protein 9 isoform X2 n=1 Tax=Dendrobates tinctorius TaxID=92724 RepID=UPI003CC96B97
MYKGCSGEVGGSKTELQHQTDREVSGSAPAVMSRADLWTWTPVAHDTRFALAHHTCTPIHGKLYLYGGVKSTDLKDPPHNDIVTFDPEKTAADSGGQGGPFRRSHHDTVVLNNRLLCVVGGWDGAQRLSTICSYDTETREWASWAEEPSSNPPAGLSSHTCTKISDRELCVVGREGGLRTQRRYASVYTLHLNTRAKTYRQVTCVLVTWLSAHLSLKSACVIHRYKEEESHIASRSGHSTVLLQSRIRHGTRHGRSLFVFGGRESAANDLVGWWEAGKIQENVSPSSLLYEQLSKLVTSDKSKHEAPKSLRHHSCSTIGPFIVVYGGETLARSRDAVCNDLYVCDTRCTPMSWFRFHGSDPRQKRVGHQTCLLNGRLYLVGGFGADGRTPCPDISVLDFL